MVVAAQIQSNTTINRDALTAKTIPLAPSWPVIQAIKINEIGSGTMKTVGYAF